MNIKNCTILVTLLLAFLSTVQAQSLKRTVGLDVGVGYTALTSYENSQYIGYSFGLRADLLRYDKWGLTSGIYFQNKGGKFEKNIDDVATEFQYQYIQLSIPLMWSYNLSKKITLHGGIYGGWNKPYNLFYGLDEYSLIYVLNIKDNDYPDKMAFRDFEFGGKFSLELKLSDKISLALTASHALQPFYINRPASVTALLEPINHFSINPEVLHQLDNRMKKAKNVFYGVEVKTNLFQI